MCGLPNTLPPWDEIETSRETWIEHYQLLVRMRGKDFQKRIIWIEHLKWKLSLIRYGIELVNGDTSILKPSEEWLEMAYELWRQAGKNRK